VSSEVNTCSRSLFPRVGGLHLTNTGVTTTAALMAIAAAPPMKMQRLPRHCTRALGKYYDTLTLPQSVRGLLDHSVGLLLTSPRRRSASE
jgi:hypothetical protein